MTTEFEFATLKSAICSGDWEKLAAALTADPSLIIAADADGMTLLHYAVGAEQTTIVANLLRYPDVPLDAPQTSFGRTPLHIAANKGNATLIIMLVEAGANVFALDKAESFPLHLAKTPAALQALHEPTIHPERILWKAIHNGDIPRIRRLLLARPSLSAWTDQEERTPLHLAVEAGSLPVVDAFLAAGAAVGAADRTGQTPLHEAVRRGNAALTSALLVAGADPRVTDHQMLSPLHIAAGKGDATRELSLPPPVGLAPISTEEEQKTSSQCSFDFDAPATLPVAKLRSKPAPSLPTPQADSARDYLSIATVLLEAGAEVNACARGRVTALHLAAFVGDAALVALLLNSGALVDPTLAIWQATPLHLAAAGGHDQVVELLLKAGANQAALDCYGRSVEFLIKWEEWE